MKRFFVCSLFATAVAHAGPIQEAINAAPPGSVLEIPAGEFRETITIKPGLTLVGAGAGETVLDADGADTAVRMAKDSALIGFTVRNAAFGIRNDGNFVGVFECDVEDFSQQGIRIEGGSAALLHNRVQGKDESIGIACLGSNPYVGYSLIEGNRVGLFALMEFIPTVDHCVFDRNRIGIEVAGGARVISLHNVFARSLTPIVGQELGEHDAVRDARPDDLLLHRGNQVEAYRLLMQQVFEQAVAMHPKVEYDLSTTPGRFHLTIAYPWASFHVLASTRDTVIEAYDAYDAETRKDLNAEYRPQLGFPAVAVINPGLTEKAHDRYILEKMFIHPPSLSYQADGRLVFDRVTNIPRIEVVAPPGYRIVEVNQPADASAHDGRQSVRIQSMGTTRVRVVMAQGSAP